jgi:tetratricopeptide (TPR) repeat protein
MATLSRVDVDAVDLPHLSLEDEPTLVNARPSREFRAADESCEDDMPSRAAWFGKLLFVGTMVSIIAAASVTAVRENAEQPWLAPWLYSAEQLFLKLGESEPEALALVETPSSEPSTPAAVAAPEEAPKTAALPAEPTVASGAVSERMLLAEVVLTNPEPSVATERALSARPHKRGQSRARAKLKPVRSKVQSAAAPAAALSPALWEKSREAARTAYAAGRYRDALVAYEQAARANPRHGLTLAGLAAARMQVGDTAGAVDAYKRAVATAPTSLTFQLGLARAYASAGDDVRARETYQRVLKLDRTNVAALAGLERL